MHFRNTTCTDMPTHVRSLNTNIDEALSVYKNGKFQINCNAVHVAAALTVQYFIKWLC